MDEPGSAGPQRIALVTGANRGIGYEVCSQLAGREHTVVLGSRDAGRGKTAADRLAASGLTVISRQLDVTDDRSVEDLAAWLASTFGRLDVLVNNAAIHYDSWQRAASVDLDVVREALDSNTLGPWRVVLACLPLLRKSKHPRIVNVSSGAGASTRLTGHTPAYSLSKHALNALTRMLAAELKSAGILVNAVCPGWVATDMGGLGGRSVVEGAAGIVWAATLPNDGPTGGFFRDRERIPW
jgi:NAD(P)-dependent dehydrogenase (short-subunit alcohol dehydrogenase family)